jgi:hypothetical protein
VIALFDGEKRHVTGAFEEHAHMRQYRWRPMGASCGIKHILGGQRILNSIGPETLSHFPNADKEVGGTF